MRFDYIVLQNYRPYISEKIIFGKDDLHQNFTIIQGPNGAGKSTLMNAVIWCLYGEETHIKEKSKALPIFNTEVFRNTEINGILEVKVEIQFIDKEGKKHIFIRSLKFRKNKKGEEEKIPDPSTREKDGSSFCYLRQKNNQTIQMNDPKYYIEQFMPSNIKDYFFFDGERLDDYFKITYGSIIRDAVFDISQITILKKAIERLIGKKKEFIRQHSGELDQEEGGIRNHIELIDNEIRAYEKDLEINKKKLRDAIILEKELRNELLKYPDTSRLEEERQEKQEELKRSEENLKDLEGQKMKGLLVSAPTIYAYKAIKNAKEIVVKGIEDGKYPPDARKDFIEHLLKTNKCICGTNLTEPNCRNNVLALLKRISTSSEISNELTGMQGILRNKLDILKNFDQEQVDLSKKIRGEEIKWEKLNREIAILNRKIGESPSDKTQLINQQLSNVEEIKREASANIGRFEAFISSKDELKEELEKKLKKLIGEKEKHFKLSKIIEFLDINIRALQGLRDEIMTEVREKTQKATRDQFFNLIWDPEAFKNVMIDDEYNISVVHHSGREGIGSLSAGQRQVLALSFMAALKTVSGFDMPIIIDTPLGRISKEPKNNIAKKLPNYLEGTQVTMLVTEEEYTQEVREKLKNRVSKEYRIIIDNPSSAKVVPYE